MFGLKRREPSDPLDDYPESFELTLTITVHRDWLAMPLASQLQGVLGEAAYWKLLAEIAKGSFKGTTDG